jgi:hypothetical protein
MRKPMQKRTAVSRATFILAFYLCFLAQPVSAGPLRILMHDGNSVEVPFCWEEDGQVKFEIAGGVVGIPRGNVLSIQEILTAGEFDPEAILKSSTGKRESNKNRVLAQLMEDQPATKSAYHPMSSEDAERFLELMEQESGPRRTANLRIHTTSFMEQGDFSDLVRLQGNGVLLVMKHILSTHEDVQKKHFVLTLYDAEGNVIQRRPCEVHQFAVDKSTLKKLGARGTLFSVVAAIRPDPQIKRYEIAALQN